MSRMQDRLKDTYGMTFSRSGKSSIQRPKPPKIKLREGTQVIGVRHNLLRTPSKRTVALLGGASLSLAIGIGAQVPPTEQPIRDGIHKVVETATNGATQLVDTGIVQPLETDHDAFVDWLINDPTEDLSPHIQQELDGGDPSVKQPNEVSRTVPMQEMGASHVQGKEQ